MTERHLVEKGELSYDFANDILFFKVKNREYSHSIEVNNIVIDIDEDDFIVGMQIFDASEMFELPKVQLVGPHGAKFRATIRDNRIQVSLLLEIRVRNKIFRPNPIVIQESDEELPDSEMVGVLA